MIENKWEHMNQNESDIVRENNFLHIPGFMPPLMGCWFYFGMQFILVL